MLLVQDPLNPLSHISELVHVCGIMKTFFKSQSMKSVQVFYSNTRDVTLVPCIFLDVVQFEYL